MTFNQIILFSLLIFSISFFSESVFASSEPILITISSDMEKIIFDGKWTNFTEWKNSSHDFLDFSNGEMIIHLRTAHFGDYIYVFVDPVKDTTINEKMDEATICIDGKNNKNIIHDSDDFCFSVLLNNKQGNIFQGTSNGNTENPMKKIPNHENFIAVSTISDENDRYTKIPHPSYEFKIPIELFDRSDNYGFYLSVYDASSGKYFSWPENSTRENSEIPSPSQWGDLISPDKSLPELNLPIMALIILISIMIAITSKVKIGIFQT